MSLEETIRNACRESMTGTRMGDTERELAEIRDCIRNAGAIIVPNRTGEKVSAINVVLDEFGLVQATHLQVRTDCCDITRMPALTKALMALDTVACDLVIARGRLGVPGSGSMLVILDRKGRILSAALSPPHILHGKSIADAVQDEMRAALERVGLEAVR